MEQNQSSTHKQQNDTYDFKNTELKHPLRWLVHGGPGVGKSYVIACIKEMFTQTMQWTQGVEFEITSLQASVADQLGGDTIHHALGIQPFNKAEEANSPAGLREVAKILRTPAMVNHRRGEHDKRRIPSTNRYATQINTT